MLPGKSDSFSFHRGAENLTRCSNRSVGMQNCRRKLEDNYDEKMGVQGGDRSVLSVLSLNDNARKTLRNGAERITKTFNTFRTSIGTFTQKFKIPTKRRQILEEGPMTPNCANTPYSRQMLGRTPTKLYSPFDIESPYNATTYTKENFPQKQPSQAAA